MPLGVVKGIAGQTRLKVGKALSSSYLCELPFSLICMLEQKTLWQDFSGLIYLFAKGLCLNLLSNSWFCKFNKAYPFRMLKIFNFIFI